MSVVSHADRAKPLRDYFPTEPSTGLAERTEEIVKVTPLGRAGGDYDIKGPVEFSSRLKRRATSAVRRLRSTATVPP